MIITSVYKFFPTVYKIKNIYHLLGPLTLWNGPFYIVSAFTVDTLLAGDTFTFTQIKLQTSLTLLQGFLQRDFFLREGSENFFHRG